MGLYTETFFCQARENTIWKVIVSDCRSTASEIIVTIITPTRKTIRQVFQGTRKLVLQASLSEGIAGYPLTDEGQRSLDASLVRIFLS